MPKPKTKKDNNICLYRIKKINKDAHSEGGSYPKFSRNGKFWSLNGLKQHLSIVRCDMLKRYSDCEIKKYRLIEENDTEDLNLELQRKILEEI